MSFTSAIATLQFKAGLPIWLAILLIALTMVAIFCFHRDQNAIIARNTIGTLIALRGCVVLIVLAVLLAPAAALTRNRHTHGTLLLILDDSRSMAYSASPLAPTRAALAQSALSQLKATLNNFDVSILPLSGKHILNPTENNWFKLAISVLQKPVSPATAIGDALERVSQSGAKPQSILIISDGRQNLGQSIDQPARNLAAQGSGIFTLCIGGNETVRDAAIDSIDAPDSILAGDNLSISANLRLDAIGPDEAITAILKRDGKQISTQTLAAKPALRVQFLDPAPPAGQHHYEVSIPPLANEATLTNNRLATSVEVTHDKINVLLMDDQPRWEYQFLHNLLQADRRVALQGGLLQPGRIENVGAPQPPSLPTSQAGFAKFDVVILGDIPPTHFTPEQQSNLVAALRAGKPRGLILIAGSRNMPARFPATPLARILPVDLDEPSFSPAQLADHSQHGFKTFFAPSAADSILSRFSAENQSNLAFWSAIPAWFSHSEFATARPGATVYWSLAEPISPFNRSRVVPDVSESQFPESQNKSILTSINYGAGRVLYLASPETWRFRHVQTPDGKVEDLHRVFWRQALRWAVAGEPASDDSNSINPDDRNLSSDPALLASIATVAGPAQGHVFDKSAISELAAALPREDRVESNVIRVGLFENPAAASTRLLHWTALVLFVALLTTEWTLRKRRGLI